MTDAAGSFTITNDDAGRRISITEPNGIALKTSYHSNGQVKAICTSGMSPDYTYNYDFTPPGSSTEQDQLQKMTKRTGGTPCGTDGAVASTTYDAYDSSDNLCWVGTSAPSPAPNQCSGTTGRSYSYVYDFDGDIKTKTTTSGTTSYGYRYTGQLCWSGATSGTAYAAACPATPAGDTTYTSDAAGNLTGTTTAPGTATYNDDNQVTALAPLSGTGTSNPISYLDHGNDLRSAVGTTTALDNGPLGITARKTSAGLTYLTRDPHGNLIDERGPGGTYYYQTDRLNTVIDLIDTTGHDAGGYTYDPYGALTNTPSATAAANPFRYTSAYQDIEGDLDYHLGARYYNPTTNHFTQNDTNYGTITDPHTTNHYTYTGDDPTNNVDPTGHCFFGVFGSGCISSGDLLSGGSFGWTWYGCVKWGVVTYLGSDGYLYAVAGACLAGGLIP